MNEQQQQDQPTAPGDAKPTTEATDEAVAESAEDSAGEEVEQAAGSIEEQLEATRVEVEENRDRWQRAAAELENFRRRQRAETAELVRYQALALARDLLPGLDNLQRAIQAASASGNIDELVEGVRMVAGQFDEVLGRHGLVPIPAVGEPFDPAVHQAVQQVPSDLHPPMTVIEEIERGYRLAERIVRPAKVIVTAAPDDAPAEGPSDADGE